MAEETKKELTPKQLAARKWYEANKDKVKARSNAQYWANPEGAKERHREYAKVNSEALKKHRRDYYHRNKIEINLNRRVGPTQQTPRISKKNADYLKNREQRLESAYEIVKKLRK